MLTALSQTSQCWKQGQHSWQGLKSEKIGMRLTGSGKCYKLCTNTINVGSLTDTTTKRAFLSLSSHHNSLLKLQPGHDHLCFSHLDWPTLTLCLRLDKVQRQSWLQTCGTYPITEQAKGVHSPPPVLMPFPHRLWYTTDFHEGYRGQSSSCLNVCFSFLHPDATGNLSLTQSSITRLL